jgi:DNA-binding transcriptional MerR regulator
VTVASEALRDLAVSYPVPELAPLLQALVACRELPPEVPDALTIAEVVAITGVSAHTLRYYERIGLVEVGRDGVGHRVYDRAALARVVFVTRLRASDMPIRDILRYVGLVRQGAGTEPERLALLQAHRARIVQRLQDMQAALAIVDYKITTYGGACAP